MLAWYPTSNWSYNASSFITHKTTWLKTTTQFFRNHFNPLTVKKTAKLCLLEFQLYLSLNFFPSIACQCIVSNLYTRLVESYVAYKWTSYFHLIRFRDFTKHFPTFLYKISKILTIFCEILEVWWMQIQTFYPKGETIRENKELFFSSKRHRWLDVK